MSGPDVDALVADVQEWVRSRVNPTDGPEQRMAKSDKGRASLDSLAALARSAADMEEALRGLRESLRIDTYHGVKYKLLCPRCDGLGWVGPENHDDPKSWPCGDCEGLGVRPAVLVTIRAADAALAVRSREQQEGTWSAAVEISTREALDAIRLAIEGASDDARAVATIRAILADGPPPIANGTRSVRRLVRAIERERAESREQQEPQA